MILVALALIWFMSCHSIDTRGEHLTKNDWAGTYHRVKAGETLALIAKKYRVSEAEIIDVNGIEEGLIKPGINLYVPEPDIIGKQLRDLPLKKPQKKNELTFHLPVKGSIVREFSSAKTSPYDGIAIKAPLGSKVKAALKGQVIFVGNDGTKFGLLVIMDHQEYITVYAQLDKVMIKVGQYLEKGEVLGTVGQSGGALFPHLHFQVRVNQLPQNPRKFIKF